MAFDFGNQLYFLKCYPSFDLFLGLPLAQLHFFLLFIEIIIHYFNHFQAIILLVYSQCCSLHHHYLISEHFSQQKEILCPLVVTPQPWLLTLFCISMNFPILDILYKWKYTIQALFVHLFSLSILLQGFIHVVACTDTSFLSMAE